MRVLLVGAGAVGLVYGRHIQLGGARVSFYVRPKYVDGLREGVTLYPRNSRQDGRAARSRGVHFGDFELLTTPREVAAQRWDQVWLCIPSTGLDGDWLAPFLGSIGDAVLVGLTPGLDDRARLLDAGAKEARLVTGQITFMAAQVPLPKDRPDAYPEPGVMYWFPPGAPSNFDGEAAPTRAVVAALRAGQCPARVNPATIEAIQGSVAVSLTLMAALELAGWSLEALRRGPLLAQGLAAGREALAITARYCGEPTARVSRLLRPWLFRPAIALAPAFIPFDLEAFIAWHFTKVGAQTRATLRTYIEQAEPTEGGGPALPTSALASLARELAAADQAPQLGPGSG
ncbi:hypothetical protein PPSIR1_26478 [Plesiocystis pacifica SIR-1]|uniref:Ketopantoate reductase N-terminal domain-containing protein n=1 Tax=Plesiocystis pacifica SIR-1 TaxID=391625 RepID=A6GA06_9BACT|nr:hypothetical protein [Plesiocystis pacifica]EDM77331.1 hypothetical protein PPSIR1_26478 [Plesiocystis pacifica SIR-1]